MGHLCAPRLSLISRGMEQLLELNQKSRIMWWRQHITSLWLLLWIWILQVFCPGIATDYPQHLEDTFVDDAFYYACRVGDIEVIKSYLEKISVHSRDSKGNTCLVIAAGRGQVEILRLLIAHGANVEDATMSGIFEGKTAIW